MIDQQLLSLGYVLEPTKYTPKLGYSRLKIIIQDKPAQRFFDAKKLSLPTFDGRHYHQTHVTRHELEPQETFQVCVGRVSMESFHGDDIQLLSFGGVLQTKVIDRDLYCDLSSNAPLFKMQDSPGSPAAIIADEINALLAEKQTGMAHFEDDLYSRLARIEPYNVFLSCLVTLKQRLDSIPTNMRRGNFPKTYSTVQKVIQVVRSTDGWDGCSPTLDELVSIKN